MRDSSQRIADLSPDEKRRLLAKLLREKTQEPQTCLPSFAQEWLWLFDQVEPGHPSYNIPSAARITGSFDLAVAQQVVNEIVRRHDVLRTTFAAVNGKPVQIIAPRLNLPLSVIELQAVSESQREEKVKSLALEEARRPFDLAQGPLLRVTLLRLAVEEHVLLVTMHHIISDGWSGAVFIREAVALYQAFAMGAPSPLPELPLQYADYVIWQRQWLKDEVLETQLGYWKRQLAGLPLLELPTDRPRPGVQSYRGAHRLLVLPKALTASLKELSRREGITLFMTLLAAFKILLSRYTGQDDIVVGSPIAGRNRAEIEGLIGLFVNFLVLRTSLSGGPTFRELLGRVRDVCLEAYAHQDLPLEKLLEILRPKRGRHQVPLFQVALDFEPLTMRPLDLGGLSITPLEVDTGTAKIDLALTVRESEETLTGFLEYSTDLFDASTMTRMLEHYVTLLEAIVANPEQSLLSLPCVDEAERRQLRLKRYKLRRKGLLDSLDDVEQLSNLTKNQLLIWVGQQLQPDVPLYNLAVTFTMGSGVDRDHLQKAFQTLVNSTDALRTVIEEEDGIPQQRVVVDFPYGMEFLDFSDCSNPNEELQAWLRKRCQVPFDLGKCLFDAVLIKITDNKFVCYLNQHHLITDGWSVWLIFHRMAEFYERSLRGRLEEKVDLPPFQRYIDYEKEHSSSSRYRSADEYWKQKLRDERQPVTFYNKTSLKRTTQVQRLSCDLGIQRTEKLGKIALQEDITTGSVDASLFNIFASVLCTYLHRISGNRRIWFGTTFHNRRSKAFKETIGLFMEVLPLSVTIEKRDTFLTLIKKVKAEMFEALRHGSYAIRNPIKNKVYDVVLNYHNMANVSHREFDGIPVKVDAVHNGHENDSFGVRILDFAAAGNLTIEFDFHCDVFDERQRTNAIEHFLRVLDAFLEDRTQPLQRISLLSPAARADILVGFNKTGLLLPTDKSIAQLFETQVQKDPERLAVVCEGQSLTYAQLNTKANQLAHHLQALGVKADVLVGICMEPSLEMLIGLLGILKAGGAYVPLDPAYPTERLSFILEDTQARVLLTQKRVIAPPIKEIRSNVQDDGSPLSILDCRVHVICLDTSWEALAEESDANPGSGTTADNLAYVIYTSGSTGSPKGVMIPQRGILNRVLWAAATYCLTEADRVLQQASFAFDTSVLEIFEPLLAGVRVVMARPGGRQDSGYLVDLIAKEKVTVAEFVPSLLQVLLEENRLEHCNCLKRIFSGGEPLPFELQERFFSRLTAELYNTYGPTEASVDVAHWMCDRDSRECIVPIGRPIANVQIYLLDSHLEPVPIGVPGELHIAGVGLARGYLNRPDLTAAHFIPNPFAAKPGARLYKTGDLARYLPDGNIEFLGRVDSQVKIRGCRIELGEIEAVLRQHPAVHEAVVLARDYESGDTSSSLRTSKRLVAYIAGKKGTRPPVNEFRSFLQRKLPEYMIPSAFVILEALPLTPNGKLDRQALPAPDQARPELDKHFIAPRDAIELQLAQIWEEVLEIRPIGVRDNFFDLGGHSLLAVHLVALIKKRLDKDVQIAAFFQQPTIEQLVSVLRLGSEPTRQSSLVSIQPRGSRRPFFLVHPVEGTVVCYANLARHLGADQPVYGLQAKGLEEGQGSQRSIEEMADHYIKAVRTVQAEDPYILGGWSLGGIVAFEMAQQLRTQGHEVAMLFVLDSWARPPILESTEENRTALLDVLSDHLGFSLKNINFSLDHLLAITPEEQVNYVMEQAIAYKLVPAGLGEARIDHYLQVYKQNLQALQSYVPRAYSGTVILFKASEQFAVTQKDSEMGWGDLVQRLLVHVVPGNHYSILREPHVQILAQRLRTLLQDAEAHERGRSPLTFQISS